MGAEMTGLRLASPKDGTALLEIYRPYIEKTSITFETEVPGLEEFAGRIAEIIPQFPYLIAEKDGTALGYAYAHAFHERAAYDWTVETSVYVREDLRGQHLGSRLYGALFQILELQRVKNACAVVTIPNDRSLAFHSAMGFTQDGLLPDFGYKLGEWHSVAYLSRRIGELTTPPLPIIPLSQLDQEAIQEVLAAYS